MEPLRLITVQTGMWAGKTVPVISISVHTKDRQKQKLSHTRSVFHIYDTWDKYIKKKKKDLFDYNSFTFRSLLTEEFHFMAQTEITVTFTGQKSGKFRRTVLTTWTTTSNFETKTKWILIKYISYWKKENTCNFRDVIFFFFSNAKKKKLFFKKLYRH